MKLYETEDYTLGMSAPLLDLKPARQMKLHASAQALLYDISKRVHSGYHWWLTGEVSAEQILPVVAKLSYQYDTSASSVVRHRRKAVGDPSAILFAWPLRNDSAGYATRFTFLLLATEHLDGEVMYDGRRKPVRVNLHMGGNAVFHLIPRQVTVERKLGRKPGPKPKIQASTRPGLRRASDFVFGWQLSAKSLEVMRGRFSAAVTSPASLVSLRQAYQALPMTSGYRSQFRAVLSETKVAWKRASNPAVLEAKRAIKEGTQADPLAVSTLPFISGFPRFYDEPPVTLSGYLDANAQSRREIERRLLKSVQADHALVGV